MPTKFTIAVFVGDPVDFVKFRHVAIHIRFADGEDNLVHVVGAHPFFIFTNEERDPTTTRQLAVLIPVASAPDTIAKRAIQKACAATPVRNDLHHQDWNCQNWVGEALSELVEIGCVTEEQRSAAIAQMMDACLEAKDEP
ncbi:hypothetical protein NUU61_003219 [Penicillium alfredii]|uniref:Uncharacterized protein n=1 Tax=Penicillium alfredii TaxID=1506179 RepID=A0A9W9KHY6_9EURO|nr:uncharacterized protein NUU61_003219 [Penicillium alfredii]KAJ5105872.1 hypothetical protein NUU61_003219 [Penicillium alfredii]